MFSQHAPDTSITSREGPLVEDTTMDALSTKVNRTPAIDWSVLTGGAALERSAPVVGEVAPLNARRSTLVGEAAPLGSRDQFIRRSLPRPEAAVQQLRQSVEAFPRPTAPGGQDVRREVERIGNQIDRLEQDRSRNQAEREQASQQKRVLERQLDEKLSVARRLASDIHTTRGQRERLQGEINQIVSKIDQLDGRLGQLASEDRDLQMREQVLAGQHRSLYQEAEGARNFNRYLENLPEDRQADGARDSAQREAAGRQALEARERLGRLEDRLERINDAEARIRQEVGGLQQDRTELVRRGEGASDRLEQVQGRLRRMGEDYRGAHQDVQQTHGELVDVARRMRVAESRAGQIQGRIEELQRMREGLLDRAIESRRGDVQDIQRQLDQIQQVMESLQGQLGASRREMEDLQGLRRGLGR